MMNARLIVIRFGVAIAMLLMLLAAVAAFGQTPDGEVPCGPVIFVGVTSPQQCARIGKTAPCDYRCGTLCWRPGRAEWRWTQDKKGCPALAPAPTPTPSASTCAPPACRAWGTGVCLRPCPYTVEPTPRPSSTFTLLPSPTPTGRTPCDRVEPNWCWTWNPATDTVICARCA